MPGSCARAYAQRVGIIFQYITEDEVFDHTIIIRTYCINSFKTFNAQAVSALFYFLQFFFRKNRQCLRSLNALHILFSSVRYLTQ